jgi:RNA polymerase sigma-70 factor (ECF subfamily)
LDRKSYGEGLNRYPKLTGGPQRASRYSLDGLCRGTGFPPRILPIKMAATNREFEADCIRRILAGEKRLFHDLIRPCERSIYLLLLSLIRNEAEAEDAAQETAIKVYQNLHLFRGESQFRTWVLSIARNEGLGRLRKMGTRREESLDAGTDEQTGDYTPAILTSWRQIPTDALEQKELGAILRKAIEGLPEIYRNIMLLRDIEELDIRETAAALGISEGAVKVRLHRARAMLQRELAPQLKAFAPKRKGFFWGRA